jgi:hypothetical protein
MIWPFRCPAVNAGSKRQRAVNGPRSGKLGFARQAKIFSSVSFAQGMKGVGRDAGEDERDASHIEPAPPGNRTTLTSQICKRQDGDEDHESERGDGGQGACHPPRPALSQYLTVEHSQRR